MEKVQKATTGIHLKNINEMKNNLNTQSLIHAEQLMQQGKIEKAISIVAPLFEKYPSDSNVVFLYGLIALHAKDFNSSIQIFHLGINLEPNSFRLNYHLALSYQSLREYRKSIEFYKKALAKNGSSIEARYNLAACYMALNRFSDAEDTYKFALSFQPKNSDTLEQLGRCYFKQSEYLKAIGVYKQLDQIRNDSQLNINIAHAYFYLNDYKKATDIYMSYAKNNHLKDYQVACRGLTNIYLKEKEIDKAIMTAEELLYFCKSQKNKYNLALALSHHTNVDKLDKAKKILDKINEESPSYEEAFDCSALVNLKLGFLDIALEQSKKSIALNGSSINFKYTLQSIYTAKGELELAKTVLLDILSKSSNSINVLRQLGIVELRSKNPNEANKHLLDAVALDPTDQRSISHHIVSLQALGEFAKAREIQSFDNLVTQTKLCPINYNALRELNVNLELELKKHPSLTWEPKGLATEGGYMTSELVNEKTSAIKELILLIHSAIEGYRNKLITEENQEHPFYKKIPVEFKLHLWGVILNKDGCVGPHIHEDSWLSGAYYVKLPNLEEENRQHAGYLEFGAPHKEIPYNFPDENHTIKPEEGLLVMFPSYYFHQTIPYDSVDERISIAFDVEAIW